MAITHYHQTLNQILLNLRKCAPCVVVPETDCDAIQDGLKQQSDNGFNQSFEGAVDGNELIIGKIVSYNFSKEDLCVCFGKKCHHLDFTPDRSLTPVWLLGASA